MEKIHWVGCGKEGRKGQNSSGMILAINGENILDGGGKGHLMAKTRKITMHEMTIKI